MNAPDRIRLQHMLDAAQEAQEFVDGRTRDDLNRDRMLTLALVKLVEIIGEAATQLSAELRAAHSQIPWVDIVGMRHRLVHAYFNINLDIVWGTVTANLPPLIEHLQALLELPDDDM